MRSIILQEEELEEIKRLEREKTAKAITRIIKHSLYFTPYGAKELEKEIIKKLKL